MATKIGQFVFQNIDLTTWTEPAPKKRKAAKPILHNKFQECAKIVSDPFWVEKWNQAAIGKFPRNFCCSDNRLYYRKNGKSSAIDLSDNPLVMHEECKRFMCDKANIKSELDLERERRDHQNLIMAQTKVEPLTWGKCCQKTQSALVDYYVEDMRKLMSLTNTEAEYLYKIVHMGISDKSFNADNITVYDNRIVSIGGLVWDNNSRTFYIANHKSKPIKAIKFVDQEDVKPKDMIPEYHKKWEKYLKECQKRHQNLKSTTYSSVTEMTED